MSQDEEPECLDSWEQLEDSETLERQIEKLNAKCTPNKNGITSALNRVVVVSRDSQMKYGPPEPSVKILKRPNGIVNPIQNGEDRQKTPMKSLQQREEEYAKARERILGEANIQIDLPSNDSGVKIFQDSLPPMERTVIDIRQTETNFGIIRQPRGPDGTQGFHESKR